MPAADLLAALHRAVLEGDADSAAGHAESWLAMSLPALRAVDDGLTPAIREAGRLFDEGEYFLPELVTAAQAMKAAMGVLRPALAGQRDGACRGRVVIGTVRGDIHEIGKTLVAVLLSAGGFEVVDLGVDVAVQDFVDRAREIDADLVGASALLTTTMPVQRDLVAAVRSAGLRAKVIVGGAPTSRGWAEEIGADGHAGSAAAAVSLAQGLVGHG